MTIQELLQEVKNRTTKGHPNYYKPFSYLHAGLLHEYYESQLPSNVHSGGDCNCIVKNLGGSVISNGYLRVVIGDYGAYLEIDPVQIHNKSIKQKWPGKPSRPVKYIWMETKDFYATKIYLQKRTVDYADYRPGYYYVSVEDVEVSIAPEK